jgi:hypothetical protein
MMMTLLILLRLLIYDPPLPSPLHERAALGALHFLARDAREVKDMKRLAWIESRWRASARSSKDACGLWQVQGKWFGVSCWELQTRPILSVKTALKAKRLTERLCGQHWLRCYQRGAFHPSNKSFLSH